MLIDLQRLIIAYEKILLRFTYVTYILVKFGCNQILKVFKKLYLFIS